MATHQIILSDIVMQEETGAPVENLRCQRESPSLSHENSGSDRDRTRDEVTGADVTTAPQPMYPCTCTALCTPDPCVT